MSEDNEKIIFDNFHMIVIEVNISQTSLIAILCAVCGGITVFFFLLLSIMFYPTLGPAEWRQNAQ